MPVQGTERKHRIWSSIGTGRISGVLPGQEDWVYCILLLSTGQNCLALLDEVTLNLTSPGAVYVMGAFSSLCHVERQNGWIKFCP